MKRAEVAAVAVVAGAAWCYENRYRISRVSYKYSPRRHALRAYQRARKGYSTEDTFDFDGYLAKVIAGGVAEIRENLHGYPMQFDKGDDDKGEKAIAEWGSILDEIVEGFTIYAEEGGYPVVGVPGYPDAEAQTRKVKRAMKLFRRWYGHLWD